MNKQRYQRFYICSLAAIIAASFYPLYMGVYAAGEMLRSGAIPMENYPKYIIPYTPISIALILGVLLIPAFQKLSQKLDFLFGAAFSIVIFFLMERFMETSILVQAEEAVLLESWQMSLCYVSPDQYQTRTWQAVDVLLGGYSPAFKLHFYLISVIIILSLLNCFYGFAKMIRSGNYNRKKALLMQAVTSISFLIMCIWACFTSFYRTGEMTVSAVSAILMAVFFALMGITAGVFAGSFMLGKARRLSILLPTIIAIITTIAMYIGEIILLNGNLYRFGSGVLFRGLGGLVLAPVDLLIIVVAGGITAGVCKRVKCQLYNDTI